MLCWLYFLFTQTWTNIFTTRNYVTYQVYQASDGVNRSSPTIPNACLVNANGTIYSAIMLALGAVHPNCRVSHSASGVAMHNATLAVQNASLWTSYDPVSPRTADENMFLSMRFPTLDVGASVTFSWAYMLSGDGVSTAFNSMANIRIVQPTDVASGSSCAYTVVVYGAVTTVHFFVTQNNTDTLVGATSTPYTSAASDGGVLYQITFDSTAFPSTSGFVVSMRSHFC